MGAKSAAGRQLQRKVEAAVLAEVERVGIGGFRSAVVLRPFLDRGLSRSTGFRWVAQILGSGKAGSHLSAKVREAVVDRANRDKADFGGATARDLAEALPPPVTPADIIGHGVVGVVERIAECMTLAEAVIRKSKSEDGTAVRLPRLALAASEHVRKCCETSVRIAEAMRDISNVDEFHRAVIAEVAAESPECAGRILQRLQHLNATWLTR